jgi:CubicO group peptidase (beta-lactamase class C family)
MMIADGTFWGRRTLRAETVREWTHRFAPAESRGLGWDMKSAQSEMKKPGERPSAGDRFSMRSFGHTGYTGTSIWIDPENQMFAVLLTNRVHPTSANEKLNNFRPVFHDAVAVAFGI